MAANSYSQQQLNKQTSSTDEPNVLVVDDEEKLGRFICMLLKRSGYRPFACRSVAEARNLLTNKSWSMVLTDIVMPKENGFELIQWIGEHHPALPVIVMTAHSTDAVENQASKLGVAAILHKPFTIDGLRQTVASAAQLSEGA
ncbi:MAG: response regulator [Chloroflexota bacterium]